jgi:hypothetical protein
MFALLGCPGGFAPDSKPNFSPPLSSTAMPFTSIIDCVEQYCKYDCAPKCCALTTLSEVRSCLGGTTPTPTDPNYAACGTAIRIISACQTIIPTFSAASTAELERCMCYQDDGTFYPQEFDDGISACDSYFATAQPTLVPVVESYLGFCTSNKLVASSTPVTASSTSSPSVVASNSVPNTSNGQVTGSKTSPLGTATAASTQATTVSSASASTPNSSFRLSADPSEVRRQTS